MATATDNQLRIEEDQRAQLLSEVRYAVSLSLTDDESSATFGSRTDVDFKCCVDQASTFINLKVQRVVSVVLNGRLLTEQEHAFDGQRLQLSELRAGDNHLQVSADCAYNHAGVGLHRFRDPVDGKLYHYTHFEPFDAHRVLACFDQPNLKARLSMRLELPSSWTVCANAPVRSSHTEADRTTWQFETTPPLPPYLFAVAAGDYDVIDGPPHGTVPMRLMCRRSLTQYVRPQAAELFDITSRGLAHFQKRFGHEYPFGTYTQIFVPEANMGAMENPGCVTFNEVFVHRGPVSELQRTRRANVILHEMVHVMGFGDVVTMRDWGDLWLNETFATVEATFAVDALGIPGAWVDFAGMVKSRALHQDQLSTTHPILVDPVDTDSIRANFDGITYHKGASVLRQLIAWVGDERYAAGIRAYFADFFWGNATRSDFLAHQARQCGRDLDDWARLWLETPGVNTLTPSTRAEDGQYTAVSVRQLPDACADLLRPHRIKVGLYGRQGDRISRRTASSVEVTGAEHQVDGLVGERVADLLIANDDDLTFAKLRFDEGSLSCLLAGGAVAIDDPHTRSICWTALHDMVRDAQLPAGEFVAAVATQSALESDDLLLERILALAVGVADRFSGDRRRPAALTGLASVAAAQLNSTRTPLLWARCLAATARDDAHLDLLQGLVAGDLAFPGLDVDVELRWMLLARLAAAGRAGASEIEAALELDPTDAGHRRAIACLAARPLEVAKTQAWAEAIEGGSLSRARLAAALSGFASGLFAAGGFSAGGRDQAALTHPYATRYLRVIRTVWETRDYEMARVITEGLFPHEPVDVPTVRAVEELIDGPNLALNCRRILMEGRDSLVRAGAARLADVPRSDDPGHPALAMTSLSE